MMSYPINPHQKENFLPLLIGNHQKKVEKNLLKMIMKYLKEIEERKMALREHAIKARTAEVEVRKLEAEVEDPEHY
jgi:hypothetical protein